MPETYTGEREGYTWNPQYNAYIPNQGPAYNPPGTPGGPPATPAPATTPEAPSTQDQLDQMFEGYSSGITESEIRQREQEARDAVMAQANATFDPLLSRARETGEKKVGSGEAQIGQSRGLGLSTAETSYIASIQKEVDDSIMEIEKAKAAYISSGNFQAQEQAENSLLSLRESKNNLILQKANMALQLQGLDIQKMQFAETQLNNTFSRKIQEAGLTGMFEGKQTWAAKQQDIQNLLAEAALTGSYNGKLTIQGEQLDLQRKQFTEDIKNQSFSNQIALFSLLSSIPQGQTIDIQMPDGTVKKFNGLQRPIGTGGGGTDDEDTDLITAAAMDYIDLENQGGGSPESYWNTVKEIQAAYAQNGIQLSSGDADKLLMQRIKVQKKEPLDLNQELQNLSTTTNIPINTLQGNNRNQGVLNPFSSSNVFVKTGTGLGNVFAGAGEIMGNFNSWLFGE